MLVFTRPSLRLVRVSKSHCLLSVCCLSVVCLLSVCVSVTLFLNSGNPEFPEFLNFLNFDPIQSMMMDDG